MWRAIGASVAGLSHRTRGDGCDDAHQVVIDDDLLVAAVADGAGSAPRGGEGARRAVEAAVAAVQQCVPSAEPQQLVAGAVAAARAALVAECGEHGERGDAGGLHELACTLAVVVATPDWLAVAQIGDVAVVIDRGGALDVIQPVDRGEYLNETVFVTSAAWADEARLAVVDADDITGLALLTDGLQLLGFDLGSGEPFPPFFRPLYEYAGRSDAADDELAAFLGSERVAARTDDDTTLVLAVRAVDHEPSDH